MSPDGYMKKWLRAGTQPWRRRRRNRIRKGLPACKDRKQWKFNVYPQNEHLDIFTKRASLKVSTSVVSVEFCSGEGTVLQCSGFIIESTSNGNIVLTTASILSASKNFKVDHIKVIVHLLNARSSDGQIVAYNLHLNVAAIRILLDTPLPAASLTRVRDCITVDPSHHVTEEESLQYHPNPSWFDLIPGDAVIAVGRFLRKPYSIMAAPGLFSTERCVQNKEFLMASCRITECGIGGPLINRFGEVIGICLHKDGSTEFLPINIASMWWEHYKKYGQSRHLASGIEVANLYVTPIGMLERIIQKFPDIVKGVIVEEVVPGSSAQAAGIKCDDVIIQMDGKKIDSVLELYESMWNKVGESVEVVVVRASAAADFRLTMVLDEAKSE